MSSYKISVNDNKLCCYKHPEAYLIEDYHVGDMICPECGLVVGDRIIGGAEWSYLPTIIEPGTGPASFDENVYDTYTNWQSKK